MKLPDEGGVYEFKSAPFLSQSIPGPKNSFSGSSWTIFYKSFEKNEKSQFWGSGGPLKVKNHPKNHSFPLIFPYRFIKEKPPSPTLRAPPDRKNQDFSKMLNCS